MKAIGYQTPAAITDPQSLVDIDLAEPAPSGRDLLVEVKAISVNPVDYKVRRSAAPPAGEWKVLGWDVAGVVQAVGEDASLFKPGDEVFYAGSIVRPGANAELHLVDERIAGAKPKSLGWAEAAALPLTAITAWEAFFTRLDVAKPAPGAAAAVLIIGGAGGVGSIAVQLARQLTELTVIATASRPETRAWVEELGAHHVIDHSQPLAPQVAALGLGAPAFVFSTTHSEGREADIAELIAPQGRVCLIDDPARFDVMPFKRKAVSVHNELMFTRSMFATPDMGEQGELLNAVARLVDEGRLKTTLTTRLSPITAATLKEAHALLETGKARGKVVLGGWPA